MTTYKDLKSAKYIESIINYAEGLLNFNFKRTGKNRYSAYCPFHVDNKDSFRVYVDGKDEVRFRCFGECNTNWDIYDVIMVRNKCSFRQAQQTFADFLGIKAFKPYGGKSPNIPDFDQLKEPEEPIDFAEPEKLAPEIIHALRIAPNFTSYCGICGSLSGRVGMMLPKKLKIELEKKWLMDKALGPFRSSETTGSTHTLYCQ